MTRAVLGIIGGSGIYDLPGLANVREERIASPWGEPSGPLRVGDIGGLPVVFLSRHDKGHRLSPSDINYRANIDVLKRAGVTDLVSLSACGSFKEELPPGTFVLIDQFVDRTHKRESSFFGKGLVAHVSMAHPVSPRLRIHLANAAMAERIGVVRDGRGSVRHRLLQRRHLRRRHAAQLAEATRRSDRQRLKGRARWHAQGDCRRGHRGRFYQARQSAILVKRRIASAQSRAICAFNASRPSNCASGRRYCTNATRSRWP